MERSTKNTRVCANGHRFQKSSDCPTCPECEATQKPKEGFLSMLAAPARRALENNGLTTLSRLAECTENQLLSLHGFGKNSIPILKKALAFEGLGLKKK